DMRLSEDVSEEGAIRFRVTAEDDDVAAEDHEADPTGRKGRTHAEERRLLLPDGRGDEVWAEAPQRSRCRGRPDTHAWCMIPGMPRLEPGGLAERSAHSWSERSWSSSPVCAPRGGRQQAKRVTS